MRLDTYIGIKINEIIKNKKEEDIIEKGEIIIKFDSKEKLDEIIKIISKK